MIKGKVTVTRRDTGLNKFRKRVAKLRRKGPAITVGVHGDAEGEYEGISVVELAAIHEFGLGQKQRSFIRAWVEEKRAEIDKAQLAMARQIVLGKISQQQGMQQLGTLFTASIQVRIASGIPPANEQSTRDRKGSSTPLIETGQLRASVDHKVEL